MQDTPLTKAELMRACVWPTIVAMIVMAVLLVERLQVDWTADCSLRVDNPAACGDAFLGSLFAWLPAAFAFGLAHIIGAASLYDRPLTGPVLGERAAKFMAYAAIHIFPAFGWYLFYAGVGGGFLISLTVIGLIVAIPFGALVAGFVAGVLLAVAAGPSVMSMDKAAWKRLIKFYGLGGAFGTLVLSGGQALIDPGFGFLAGADRPWLTALCALTVTALSCGLLGAAALKASGRSSVLLQQRVMVSGLARIASVAIVLSVPVHLMVLNGVTVFGDGGGPLASIASLFRDHKPPLSGSLSLAGLKFTGPRAALRTREITLRSRMVTTTLHAGTPQEVNHGHTVNDPYVMWLLAPPSIASNESVYVVADSGGVKTKMQCWPEPGARTTCSLSPGFPLKTGTAEQTRTLAMDIDEEFEFVDGIDNAALSYRWDNRTRGDETDVAKWKRLFCRLHVLGVTKAAFSVSQIVPCDADWPAEAIQVRSYVEGLFALDGTASPSTKAPQ
jgi:hypothetical protein